MGRDTLQLQSWIGARGRDGGKDGELDTLGTGHRDGSGVAKPAELPPHVQSSPMGAKRLNTITREIGPSCRIVHVCRTSAWRARTQGPVPALSPTPTLAPDPASTSTPLVHVGYTDITTLTAES